MIIDDYKLYKNGIIFNSFRDDISDKTILLGYYMGYHLNDSLICMKAIENCNFCSDELYGDFNLKNNRINYYHHYVVSLFVNLGIILKGQEMINNHIGGKLIDISLNSISRNTIVHIFEKLNEYEKIGIVLSGFNVIESEKDGELLLINKPLCTLDLINHMIYIFGNIRKNNLSNENVVDVSIDLVALKKELGNAKCEIDSFNEYVNYFTKKLLI